MEISLAKIAKSSFFVPGIVISVVAIGWLFLLITEHKPSEEPTTPTTWSQKEDYKIIETSEGKFVENEKAGLSFKVPDGWRVEIDESTEIQLLVKFFEKNAKRDLTSGFLIEGCGWQLGIEDNKAEAQRIVQDIGLCQHNNVDLRKEVIDINGHRALKIIVFDDPKLGKDVYIGLPLEEKISYFRVLFFPGEEERCSREFDKFLETVLIK